MWERVNMSTLYLKYVNLEGFRGQISLKYRAPLINTVYISPSMGKMYTSALGNIVDPKQSIHSHSDQNIQSQSYMY